MTFEGIVAMAIERGGVFGGFGGKTLIEMPGNKEFWEVILRALPERDRFYDPMITDAGFIHFRIGKESGDRRGSVVFHVGYWRDKVKKKENAMCGTYQNDEEVMARREANQGKMLPESVAKICHEANRAYCESLGDHSQPSWDEAPAWQRVSAVNGVEFHLEELRAGKSARPEASHENWMREKDKDGWKYGAVKDPGRKEHPCFVRFDELPPEQQAKDYLFVGIVRALWNAGMLRKELDAK